MTKALFDYQLSQILQSIQSQSSSYWKSFSPILLVFGGLNEREVSLQSAQGVREALVTMGLEVVPWDIKTDKKEVLVEQLQHILKKHPIQFALIMVHGGVGEDGTLQSIFESTGIAFSGSNASSCRTTINKVIAKEKVQSFTHVAVPLFFTAYHLNEALAVENLKPLGFPLAVKPPCDGSSLGVSLVSHYEQLAPAFHQAQALSGDGSVLIEQWIKGREVTVGVICEQPLEVIEVLFEEDFYNYEAKYISEQTQLICPADIAVTQRLSIRQKALEVFNVLAMHNWGRVDFILENGSGELYFLEANAVPGMTSHSLVPKAAQYNGFTMDSLVKSMLHSHPKHLLND